MSGRVDARWSGAGGARGARGGSAGGTAGDAARCRERGTSLVELIVALLCSSLLAAGVLSLVADAAWLCRQQRARVEAQGVATTAAGLVARALEEAGAGLEGARAIRWRGEVVPVIEVGDSAVSVVAAVGATVEVEPWVGAGASGGSGSGGATGAELAGRRFLYQAVTLRPPGAARGSVGLGRDDRVAGLGLADEGGAPLDTLPAGSVVASGIVAGRGHVIVDWDAAPAAAVRALVPVRRREIGVRPFEGAWQLRRRDDDGRWQPMVDSVGELTVAVESSDAVITARALLPSGSTAIARRRVVLRGAR